jgi:Lon-like protease
VSIPEPDDLDRLLAGERPPRDRPLRAPWWTYLGFGLLLAAVTGTVLFALAPAPYVVERPGPVFDTLGDVEDADGADVPLIEIPGETTYPTDGVLDMLTVYLDGSRENPLSWLDVARAWFDPSRAVVPIDQVYPEGQTDEESDQESAQQMSSSQEDAVAAALGELGIAYGSTVTVADVMDGSPSDGVLEPGDEILEAGGAAVSDADDLRAAIATAGVGGALDLGVSRDGEELTVTLEPAAAPDSGDPVIGIYLGADYDFPFDVEVKLQNVGGPSAGSTFALAIYDKLTPGALTGGEHIASTGTVDPDGDIGAIGGVVQKMYGARGAGADWMLVPESNCSEVVGHVPSGLEVFAVADLDEAIATIDGITSGDTGDLARCTG